MSGYLVPGGSTVQPALVAYRPVTLNANTTLVWPTQSQSTTDFAARVMNVTAGVGPFNLLVPPANQVSTGFDLIVSNVGSNSFNLQNNAGVTIATITPGQRYYFNLTDNTTVGGVWDSFLFGAGSSSLSAAAIAGFGLIATGATLSQNRVINTTSASPINISATDRASVYVWQGGGGTVNLPAVTSLTNGFFTSFVNEGSGTLTFTPNGADTIDGLASITLGPNLSLTIHAGTSGAWYTSGKVPAQQFNFTELIQTVTGGTLTETLTQAQNVVQRFIGTLTSNQTITFPNIVQIYYVQNATAGAFTTTFGAAGGGTAVQVPQGTNAILFSDGTNVINASNAQLTATTSISIAQGSAASPSLNFGAATTPDPTTGLFQPVTSTVGVTLAGVEAARFTSTGLNANMFVPTSSTVPTNGMFLPAANTIGFATNSTKWLSINSTGNIVNVVPTSGVALTLTAVSGSDVLDLNGNFNGNLTTNLTQSNTSGSASYQANVNGLTALFQAVGAGPTSNVGTFTNHGVNVMTNNTARIAVAAAGNITANAPSSGTTIAVNVIAGQNAITTSDGTASSGWFSNGGSGVLFGTSSAHALGLTTQGSTRISIGSTGLVNINTTTTRQGLLNLLASGTDNTNGDLPGTALNIIGPHQWTSASNSTSMAAIESNDNFAQDVGGDLAFGGRYTTSSALCAHFAVIAGRKENATSGDFSGYLVFGTRQNGNQITERMRISSAGAVTITAAAAGQNAVSVVDGTATSVWFTNGGGGIILGTTSNHPVQLYSNNLSRILVAASGSVTLQTPTSGNHQFNGLTQYSDGTVNAEIGWRSWNQNVQQSSYTLVATDRGRCIVTTTSGITYTCPNSVFDSGNNLDVIAVENASTGTITIAAGSGVTMRLAGTATTGNRTVASKGLAFIFWSSASEAWVYGPGVS